MSFRLGALMWWLLFAPAASAQSTPAIAYEAPTGCPVHTEAERRLVETLGVAARRSDLPPLSASVTIVPRDAGYAAAVVIRDGEHETRREIFDASCALVVDAAVLIIAVALVPDLVPFELGAEPESLGEREALDDAPEAATEPSPSEVAAPALSPRAPAAPELSGTLRLSAHASVGALPGVVLGGEVAGGIRYDALRVELAIRGLPLAAARFGVDPSLGADLALVAGLLRALAVATLEEHFEVHGGGGIDVGVALGRGVGLSVPRDAAAPWLALEGAIGAAWLPLREVGILFEVELLVPVLRPVFVASGLGTLFRPEPVAGALRLGVEARFP